MSKCDNCGKDHKRRRFCSNRCKDSYHNRTNPRGIGAFVKERQEAGMHEESMGAIEDGWDGHKNAF